MDKIRRDKQKEVHTRLDFRENSRKSRRMREDSQNSSAKTLSARYRNPSERPQIRDRFKNDDGNVFGWLGYQRQSAFKRQSDTYSPSARLSPGRTGNTLEMVPTVQVIQVVLTNRTLLLAETVLEAESALTASKNRMVIPSLLTEQGTNIGDPDDHVKNFQASAQKVQTTAHGNPGREKSNNKFCKFHNDKVHSTDECVQLKKQIEELIMTRQKVTQTFAHVKEIMFLPLTANKGTGGPLVIEAEISGHAVNRIYVDGGSSMEVLYELCFNRLKPKIKSQMVLMTTSLTGFSGETIWPLRQLRLLVTIWDAEHYTKVWMNFMIVRSPSPYNDIIGRPGTRKIQAVPSTAYEMIKFSVNGEIVTICSTILMPTECTTIVATPKHHAKKAKACHKIFKVAIHLDFSEQEITIRGTVSIKARTELCTLLKRKLDIFA
nr:reverse transcriptase domain-containing protein [Tanacetum cinerariifolium]